MVINQGWTYQEKVNSQSAGQTLLDYYSQNYQHSSQEEWQNRILAGQILINHQVATPETILKKGQQLSYQRSPWEELDVPLNFVTLYEDTDLMIIAKPSGLPVLPGGGFLQNTLLYQLQQRYPQEMPVPIHRLGRGTSGLMLIARSVLAKSKLSQQMRDRQICKIYRALIGPSELPTEFTINQAIGKMPHPILGYLYGATPTGKFAQSNCRVLEQSSTKTLLEISILTGRPHQIRIHLAAIGYPLLGDPLYDVGGIAKTTNVDSKIFVPSDCGYFLHAHQLSFLHPATSKKLSFVCPPPPELIA
jgi:23S rRNA pseudouridine1911/1915/1917 synthase